MEWGERMECLENIDESFLADGIRSKLGKFAQNVVDRETMKHIFVCAGKEVADYEKDNSEECEIRQIIFQEDNMKQFAVKMSQVSPFQWQEKMNLYLDNILSESVLSDDAKRQCGIHFQKIVMNEIMLRFQNIYEQNILGSIYRETHGVTDSVTRIDRRLQKMDANLMELLEENKTEKISARERQEHSSRQERYSLPGDGSEKGTKPIWKLSTLHFEAAMDGKGNKRTETIQAIETWKIEREQYPGWYIAPFYVCKEVEWKTRGSALLQKSDEVTVMERMQFAYEYTWRMEIGMQLYSGYEQEQIRDIWENYRTVCLDSLENVSKEEIEHWFYMGQVLLREYREDGDKEQWNYVYRILDGYKEYGRNGTVELELEKIKFYFMRMELGKAKRLLEKQDVAKNQYEVRLQSAGMMAELGKIEESLTELKSLWQDISEELEEAGNDAKRKLWLESLRVCMLQLYSLALQGDSWRKRQYEGMQEDINRILEYIDNRREYFDWNDTLAEVKAELLKWHVKEYQQSEPFELNRESIFLTENRNTCDAAYLLYRILDRLALPLQINHVSLLGEMELVWLEALTQLNMHVATFVMIRGGSSSNIKNVVGYRILTELCQEQVNFVICYLKNALEYNLEELAECNTWEEGNIYSGILQNVPQMLIRYMVRCPETMQSEMLLLLKKMLEIPGFDLNKQMNTFLYGVMRSVSDRIKLEMIGTMLECGMYEREIDHGWYSVSDVFDFYSVKEESHRLLRQNCRVTNGQIERLIEKAVNSEIEWKFVVTRLRELYELELLNPEQEKAFSGILWKRVNSKNGLPDIADLYMWVYMKLPHPRDVNPKQKIKEYFLQTELKSVLQDKNGCSMTMGEIRYLDELLALLRGLEDDFWTISEAECLLENMKRYWDADKEKYFRRMGDAVGREYGMRFRKVIRVCSELYQSVTEACSESVRNEMTQMIQEMREAGLDVLQLEMLFYSETKLSAISENIITAFHSANIPTTVDAMLAAETYCKKSSGTAITKRFVWELINLVRTRKEPGLITALNILHNILYRNKEALTEEELQILDYALVQLAEQTDYKKQPKSEKERKRTVEIRVACAGLAYRLYQRQERRSASLGVRCWQELCEKEEELTVVRKVWKG